MKKKLIIYLLAAVMVLSPAAVFADAADTAGTDAGELDIVQSEAMLFNGNPFLTVARKDVAGDSHK